MFAGSQAGGEHEVLYLQSVRKVVCLGHRRGVIPSSPKLDAVCG